MTSPSNKPKKKWDIKAFVQEQRKLNQKNPTNDVVVCSLNSSDMNTENKIENEKENGAFITLVSNDGKRFQISEKVAFNASEWLRNLFVPIQETNKFKETNSRIVDLPLFSGDVVEKIVRWLKMDSSINGNLPPSKHNSRNSFHSE